ARILDAMQVDAQRPYRRAPALLIDTDHPRSGAECRDARERGALYIKKLLATDLRAAQAQAFKRRASRRLRRRDQVLALGQEASVARALALCVQAANGLQAGILG